MQKDETSTMSSGQRARAAVAVAVEVAVEVAVAVAVGVAVGVEVEVPTGATGISALGGAVAPRTAAHAINPGRHATAPFTPPPP
jgi:hypothetical protein